MLYTVSGRRKHHKLSGEKNNMDNAQNEKDAEDRKIWKNT